LGLLLCAEEYLPSKNVNFETFLKQLFCLWRAEEGIQRSRTKRTFKYSWDKLTTCVQVSEAMRSKAEAEQRSELLAAQNQDLLKENMRLKYA
jgi:hypothetical protein